MLELKYAIYHRVAQASLILPLVEGQLNSGITLAAVAKESIAWTSVEAARQPFCGWMTKPVHPI